MIQNTVKTAKLIIKDEHGKERIHELVDDVTTIGRSSSNTIQVTDEKSSRSHFRIERSGDVFKLIDQGSTNGTKLNGLKIEENLELRPGDEIRLGKTTFIFEAAGAPREQQLPETEKVNMDHAAPQEKPVLVPEKKKEEKKEEKKAESKEPPKKEEEKGAPTEPKYVLRVTEGKTPGNVYELGSKALTIGRHASNTIQIIDEAASNYHAEVTREPMGYVLTDLGSTNGTKVKGKEHPDFEKVVKVPLHPGMQVRIGKTIMRYENIGAPAEDDALFGTVALDSAKLGAQLNEDPTTVQRRKVVAVAAAVMIFVVGAWAIAHFSGPTVKTPEVGPGPAKVLSAVNRIPNSSFDEGTDDDGNPKNFTRGTGSALIKVTQDAERKGTISDPTVRGAGLQIITKPSGNLLATLSVVETQVGFPVDPGKAYEYSGWMRNDGNGLYGLRVTWTKGERSLSENPVVLKETQEWKEKKAVLTPPPWCDSARVGVFSLGSEGRASFDDLSFRESAAEPFAPAKITYGGITYLFEGMKGAFTVLSQGERVLEEGTLVLEHPEKKASCDLSTASDTHWTKPDDGSLASVDGKLYDFAIPAQNEFKIEVRQSGSGVTSTLTVTQPDDAASKPNLRFLIVGSTAAGDIDIGGGEGTERLAGADDKVVPAARSLLFNAGKTPQLELTFSKPVEATLKREGSKRRVQLRFSGELKVGYAPESVADKQKMTVMIGDLQKAVKEQRWGDAEGAAKALSEQFGQKFAPAREEANKAREVLDKAWTACQTEITRTMAALGKTVNPELIDKAIQTVKKYQQAWAGAEEKAKVLTDAVEQIEAIRKAGANEQLETKAEELYKKAMTFIDAKPPVYNVAIAFLKKIINDTELSKTKAAEKAREMLPKVERKAQMKDLEDQLRDKVKNNITAGDYKNAVLQVEKDAEYQNNKDEMPDLKSEVEGWKKKIK